MIRVLETESSKGWGGQEKRTVRLARHMDNSKITTFFAVPPDSHLFKNQTSLGITAFPVKLRKTYDLQAVWNLIWLIKHRRIDMVVTHSGKDAWLGGMAAFFCGIPCVRVRHLQTPFKNAFSYTKLSTAVVATSEHVRAYVVSRGVPEKRAHTIYTGINTEIFQPRSSALRQTLNISHQTVLIGIVAILRADKCHIDLIRAIAILQNKHDIALIIAGNGPQEKNLKSCVQKLGLQNTVYFLGFYEDTVSVFNALDICVLPSRMEASGGVLLEAQSCGVPVVGSRVGGIPECIQEGKTGLLFESGNIQDLVQTLERLISDSALKNTLSSHARLFVQENFSVQKMVNDTTRLYHQILNQNRS
jgi:L-malate glycosyltransferase